MSQTTVKPRNTGNQGTNKFHLLLADFRKLKEFVGFNCTSSSKIGGLLSVDRVQTSDVFWQYARILISYFLIQCFKPKTTKEISEC